MNISSTRRDEAKSMAQARMKRYQIPWNSDKAPTIDEFTTDRFVRKWIGRASRAAESIKDGSEWDARPDVDPDPNRVRRNIGATQVELHEIDGPKETFSRKLKKVEHSATWHDGQILLGEEYGSLTGKEAPTGTRLRVEGETLKLQTTDFKTNYAFAFDELSPKGWRKKKTSKTVLFSNEGEKPYPDENRLRAMIKDAERLFIRAGKDLDPDPNRFYDGSKSVTISATGSETAQYAARGVRKEVKRENGKITSIRIRKDQGATVTDTTIKVGLLSAKETVRTYVHRKTAEAAEFSKFENDALDVISATIGTIGIIGIGLGIAVGLI